MDNDVSPSENLIWCVIPTYNNKDTILEVALECLHYLPHVLVVDDGSTDCDPSALLKDTGVMVIKHDRNRGKGIAILTALDYVADRNGAFIITLDGDGQHFPADIKKFLPLLREDDTSIVVGSRDFSRPVIPRGTRFGRVFSNFWLRLETGVVLPDSQSGYRSYPVKYLSQLPLKGRHYDFEVEVLAKASWAGLQLKSVDIGVWYPDDPKKRVSSFKPFLDNLRISLTHMRLIAQKLVFWPQRKLIKNRKKIQFIMNPRKFITALMKEHNTPEGLAASAAMGVFFGALPLISLHMVVVAFVASRLNLNRVMALGIQNLCMPPFVPLACIQLGYFMRYGKLLTEVSKNTVVYQAMDRLYEWFIGSLILAPLLAVIAALLVFWLAKLNRRTGNAQ